jgi:hypothetical protein
MVRVRLAFDPLVARTDAFRRALAALERLWSIAIELHQRSVIDTGAKRALNRFEISLMAVARRLNAIGKARAKIVNKPRRALTVASANEV